MVAIGAGARGSTMTHALCARCRALLLRALVSAVPGQARIRIVTPAPGVQRSRPTTGREERALEVWGSGHDKRSVVWSTFQSISRTASRTVRRLVPFSSWPDDPCPRSAANGSRGALGIGVAWKHSPTGVVWAPLDVTWGKCAPVSCADPSTSIVFWVGRPSGRSCTCSTAPRPTIGRLVFVSRETMHTAGDPLH